MNNEQMATYVAKLLGKTIQKGSPKGVFFLLDNSNTLSINRYDNFIDVSLSTYNKKNKNKATFIFSGLTFELEKIMVIATNGSSFVAERKKSDHYIYWTQKKHCLALTAKHANLEILEDIFVSWREANS